MNHPMADTSSALLSQRLFTRPQRFVYRIAGVVVAGGLASHALVAHWGPVAAAVEGVLVLALALLGPGAMYVRADADGVTVRNMLRIHRVAWEDVRGFSLDEQFPYLAYLDVADGRELPVLAIADDPWVSGAKAHDRNIAMLEGLNGMWRAEVVRATTGVLPAPAAGMAEVSGSFTSGQG